MLFMGIDAGTQGVRAVAADENGRVVASESCSYAGINVSPEPGRFEQSAHDWYAAVVLAVSACVGQLKKQNISAGAIAALGVDGTSGTVLPVDKDKIPLMNAMMYNDMRAGREAALVREKAQALEKKLGYKFNASFALPKILWIRDNLPEVYAKTSLFLHQTDYIVGRLSGEYGVTDYSNALKTGYDLISERWPDVLEALGIGCGRLPRVAAPGKAIGKIQKAAALELGLSEDTVVVAGATDGYASALAAGAVNIGDWASVIGTTLVLKGVTKDLLVDPDGVGYSHKMPSGAYMLGGASNVGGKCLNVRFDRKDFSYYDRFVDSLSPTGVLIYPLTGRGERFPFLDPDAEEFITGDASDKKVLYTALMEGVGFAERLAFDRMQEIGAEVANVIYTSGGACRSDEWLRIRASILQKQLRVPAVIDAAMGSALLAASARFGSLSEAASRMIRFDKIVDPVPEKINRFDELYGAFAAECRARYKMGGRQ
jgi:sugar (pentulose or hexulose) kinase